MSQISCPSCGTALSSDTAVCFSCGFPVLRHTVELLNSTSLDGTAWDCFVIDEAFSDSEPPRCPKCHSKDISSETEIRKGLFGLFSKTISIQHCRRCGHRWESN